MSQGDEDTDKPYDPTQKKLDDAREKGEVPRSTDLITTGAYAGLLLAGLIFGQGAIERVGTALEALLSRTDKLSRLLLTEGGNTLGGGLMAAVAIGLLPLFLMPPLFALASVIGQRAFTVTGSKLAPKLSRISLLSNAKNKFGRGGLFEFAKSFAKLVIFSVALGIFMAAKMETILGAAQLGPGVVVVLMVTLTMQFMMVVVAVSLAIGVIDLFWQHAEHIRKHRMSHKDLTDETKQSEGDPHMKQQRRQRGYDIATNRMIADVPDADVVVVNPTHYAAALKWSRKPGAAPVCVAKGVDEVALRIREVAADADVPIQSDPPTARAVYATVEIGQEIRVEHYQAVASAIRFADAMRRKARARGYGDA